MLNELTTKLEQAKASVVTLEADKSELEQLLQHHHQQLSEARARGAKPSELLPISEKAGSVQRLLDEQTQLVSTAQSELKKLEHDHALETAIANAITQVQTMNAVKAAIGETIQELEKTLQPFREKFQSQWQQWNDERVKYFEFFSVAYSLGVISPDKDRWYNLQRFEEFLAGHGLTSEQIKIIRESHGFSSGWNSYNETALLEHPDPLMSDLVNRLFNATWHNRVTGVS